MKIERNPGLEGYLKAEWIGSFLRSLPPYTLGAEGIRDVTSHIHLSDLLNVRQSYFKRIMPLAPSEKDVQLWMYGRGFEVEVARRTSLVPAVQRFAHDISYRPDFDEWPDIFGGPIELKWRRANLAGPDKVTEQYDNYLVQISGYCALERELGRRETTALLIVDTPRQGQSAQDRLAETRPECHVYDIEFTSDELDRRVVELLTLRDLFVAALKDGTAAAAQTLPVCYDWLCGSPYVDKPAFCNECHKELFGTWGEKHTGTKVGAGHTVRPATWRYDVRCPWYVFSQPNLLDPTRGSK